MNKKQVTEAFEKALIEYQEEATSKWSNIEERVVGNIKYEAVNKLFKELGLEE